MSVTLKVAEYKPSLLCRMIGHRFSYKTSEIRTKDTGREYRDTTEHVQPFCTRCGMFNPNTLGEETLKAILKRELGI